MNPEISQETNDQLLITIPLTGVQPLPSLRPYLYPPDLPTPSLDDLGVEVCSDNEPDLPTPNILEPAINPPD